MTPDEAVSVLAIFDQADLYEGIIWRVSAGEDGGRDVKLFATCSDFFHYATADLEEITAEDVPALQACAADLEVTGEPYFLGELFAARKRKLRPLPLACQEMDEETRALFGAAGTAEARADADQRDAAFWSHVAQKVKGAATGSEAP